MPICALCQGECDFLKQSHIVPKLVYKRIKSHPQSRFRNLSNFNLPLQDGEKHKMLCSDCEQKFSKLETKFANEFFDSFLRQDALPEININKGWLGNYCLSVVWRILNDDLYRLNSFEGEWSRSLFEEFENTLRKHLNASPIDDTLPCCAINYIFRLDDIITSSACCELLEKIIFGYAYFDIKLKIFVVYSSYAGLIFATTLIPDFKQLFMIDLNASICDVIGGIFRTRRYTIIKSLQQELKKQCSDIARQYKRVMTSEVHAKIRKHYTNKNSM